MTDPRQPGDPRQSDDPRESTEATAPSAHDADGDLVIVGRVIKPHGIRGEVVVQVLSDVPDRLAAGGDVVLGGHPATIVTCRPHQGRLLVGFAGVADRNAAEALRGRTIEAARVDLDDLDTYFAHELIGLPVLDEDGTSLGTVVALIELPDAAGYDLLEVQRSDASTWLLPAVEDYVEVEEPDDGGLRLRLVDAPAGLVDVAVRDDTGTAPTGPSSGSGP